MPTAQVTELDSPRWFVCQCNPQRMTHSVRSRLEQVGAEYYMATHRVLRRQGKVMADVEESYLGGFFFVRLTLRTALKFQYANALDYRYVRDGHKQLLWVPDRQMADFRRVVDTMQERADFSASPLAVGDRVVVTRGPLVGVEGVLTSVADQSRLVVSVVGMFAVSVRIGRTSVRRV